MFTTIKTKEVALNQDEILASNLFLYIEKNSYLYKFYNFY